MTYYIVLPMNNTMLFIESSDDAVRITNRLATIQNIASMKNAVVMSKRLYERIMMQPLSTKEKIQLFHSLYIDCRNFCRLQRDSASKSKKLFKLLVRRVSSMAYNGIELPLAINHIKATLGAE